MTGIIECMPATSAPTTSRRLLALLSPLQARREWTGGLLAERLDVSERTVRKDIDRLAGHRLPDPSGQGA